jgi:hypothetical protein
MTAAPLRHCLWWRNWKRSWPTTNPARDTELTFFAGRGQLEALES